MKRVWDDYLTDRDREVFRTAGYGLTAGFAEKPALLIIDINHGFVGDKREDIFKSMKKFRNSCGEVGWDAMARLVPVIQSCRARDVPVIFTTSDLSHALLSTLSWGRKNSRVNETPPPEVAVAKNAIPEMIAPEPSEVVIYKKKPSAFFGTPLIQYLISLGVNQLLCCGTSTSGCVRATVLDAFSFNFRVAVIEDCTFDRGEASHAMTLFDLHQKYADVVSSGAVLQFIEGLPRKALATTWSAATVH